MEKKTPLYEKHLAAGGKLVPFAGYTLPVQYGSGILAEHRSVREKAGLFDVSHMGEFVLEGENALICLNLLLTNDFTNMQPGQARYSPMCYENGGTVDDLLVYKVDDQKYYIVVNAANKQKDFDWMRQNLPGGAQLRDISDSVAQLALQGPASPAILQKVTGDACIPDKYYTFSQSCDIAGVHCLVSRTGYTGETGFELYCCADQAGKLWDALLAAGAPLGLIPCGLGARDTLRLEAGMPLYGHELSADISPKEAGLSFAIQLDKPAFIGKDALGAPRTRKRIGLRLLDRGIAREGADVCLGGQVIGTVTSGTMSPTLGVAIAMALVPASFDGAEVTVDVRGRALRAEITPLPFYKAPAK